MASVGSRWGPSLPNRFWPLGELADDIDPTLLDALEVDLAGDAPASSQVRRLRLMSSQVPVLPSRDKFVATTDVVDSGAESDIVSSGEVGLSVLAEHFPREEFPDMDISNASIRAAFVFSRMLIWRAFSWCIVRRCVWHCARRVWKLFCWFRRAV